MQVYDKVIKYDTVVQRILCKRDKTSSRRIQEIENQLDATVVSYTVTHLDIRDMYASIYRCVQVYAEYIYNETYNSMI